MEYIGKHVSSQTWDFYRLHMYVLTHYLLHPTKTHFHILEINAVIVWTYVLYRLEYCGDSWNPQFFSVCHLWIE